MGTFDGMEPKKQLPHVKVMHKMKAWFKRRNAKEKMMLGGGAAVLVRSADGFVFDNRVFGK